MNWSRIIIGAIIGFLLIVVVTLSTGSKSDCSRTKEDAPIAGQPDLKLIGNYKTDNGWLQVYTCGKDTVYMSTTNPGSIDVYIAVK